MSHAPPASTSDSDSPLEADLELVLQGRSLATIVSRSRSWPDADVVAKALRDATSPAFTGIETLSIEAQRKLIEVAERARAKLLLGLGQTSSSPGSLQVVHTATLGHVFDSELILWVGTHGDAGPLERRIAREQLRGAFLQAELESVQRLRSVYRANPKAEPMGAYNRVAAVLAADCDPRVVSQWHRFAAEMQPHVRLAVMQLPRETAMNRRGAIEVACWQTGLSLEAGGIDFADGAPRRCPQLASLLDAGSIDLLVDFSCESPELPAEATHIQLPADSLCRPSRARVMRCDGIMLWLKQPVLVDDAPDEAAAWLAQLATATEALT